MRSRYSAFALRDAEHLLRTWHPDTRPDTVDLPTARRWTRLRVLATERGGADDTEGTVEFRAHFRDRGEPGVLSERSRFERVDGAWHYLDGDVHPSRSS
jgi:SEC-C motif-containing protein